MSSRSETISQHIRAIQKGNTAVVSAQQLATDILRRDPRLRGDDQSWTDWKDEVQRVARAEGLISDDGGAEGRGEMTDARRKEIVDEVTGVKKAVRPVSVALSVMDPRTEADHHATATEFMRNVGLLPKDTTAPHEVDPHLSAVAAEVIKNARFK